MVADLVKSIRPRQWTKNFIVFGALVFVPGALLVPGLVLRSVLAFVLFSLAAGAGYIFNDIRDRDYDREHPRKKDRPIASGRLPVGTAMLFGYVLVIIVLAGSYYLDSIKPDLTGLEATPLGFEFYAFTLTLAGYLLLTFVYSMWLRNTPLLDVIVLSIGFILRAVGGAVALGVIISPWLLLCTGLLALYLALGKRRQELLRLQNSHDAEISCDNGNMRKSLCGYTIPLLDQLLIIAASVNVMSYSLYTFLHSEASDTRLMLTIPFVLYGIFRYHWLIHYQDKGEAPDEVLLNDRPLAICVLLWVIVVGVLLHAGGS